MKVVDEILKFLTELKDNNLDCDEEDALYYEDIAAFEKGLRFNPKVLSNAQYENAIFREALKIVAAFHIPDENLKRFNSEQLDDIYLARSVLKRFPSEEN